MADLTPETIAAIAELVREAYTGHDIPMPQDVRNLWRAHARERPINIPIPPPPRAHEVCRVDDIVDYVVNNAGCRDMLRPSIWISEEAVVLALHDTDRWDRVTCRLTPSDQLDRLLPHTAYSESGDVWFDQADFLDFLRISLGQTEHLALQQFSRLNWSNTHSSEAKRVHAEQHLGHALTEKVASEDGGGLPDAITLEIPVLAPGWCESLSLERALYTIHCAITLDMGQQRIRLRPFPGEIDSACARSVSAITAYVRALLDSQVTKAYKASKEPAADGDDGRLQALQQVAVYQGSPGPVKPPAAQEV
ncbi:MAG: hypothetical protein GY835_24615 [bacterium]|nr:hypothetical protein [bacterium]